MGNFLNTNRTQKYRDKKYLIVHTLSWAQILMAAKLSDDKYNKNKEKIHCQIKKI